MPDDPQPLDRPIRGSCMCGRVRFELTHAPLWMSYCQCSRCRKSGGTTNLSVRAEHFRWEGAVTDGNLITASGIAPVEFAKEIFGLLSFYDSQTIDNWYLLYRKQDPAGFFGLMEGASVG